MENNEVRESDMQEVSDSELKDITGGQGSSWDAMVLKNRYKKETGVNMRCNIANEYCDNYGCTWEKKPKYACPVCGSTNVCNRDPGTFRLMRVICFDCGSFKDRKGGDPWGLGEA